MAFWLALYVVVIMLGSMGGGLIPLLVRVTHTRMQLMLSFVAGAMLGVGLLHLMPHAIFELRNAAARGQLTSEPVDVAVGWMLGGFIGMFFIERFFHFHHHAAPDEDPAGASDVGLDCVHTRRDEHHHDHAQWRAREQDHGPAGTHKFAWLGALVGMMLHTMIDGVALAASVNADTLGGDAHALPAVGVFLVIGLHKPFDSMAIGTLMAAGGWSHAWRLAVNVLYATAIPLGVAVYFLLAGQVVAEENSQVFLGAALAFASGTFLCIATSDLLPELQFHSHDRLKLSLALILGLAVAIGVGYLEGDHYRLHQGVQNSVTSAP